ncbi:hypothetical protein GCM10010286_04780 [Streptomyces toxytricini]|nr:hypothetical protein GCM10010286_04780 [Streptomyces toxytricini]
MNPELSATHQNSGPPAPHSRTGNPPPRRTLREAIRAPGDPREAGEGRRAAAPGAVRTTPRLPGSRGAFGPYGAHRGAGGGSGEAVIQSTKPPQFRGFSNSAQADSFIPAQKSDIGSP